MTQTLKGELFNYSTKSVYVKLAVTKLMKHRKMKDVKIDEFVVRKNVINEGDLLLAMFDIEEQSQARVPKIDLRKR